MKVTRETAEVPVFRILGAGRELFYAPGHVAGRASAELQRRGASASAEWRRVREEPFSPVCLTVNLTDKCNFSCGYCFSKAGRSSATVSMNAVSAAARLVARNCSARGKPFNLVLHGGGEPTVEWGLLQEVTLLTKRLARESSLDWFGYIATNGTASDDHALWLGREFSLIGLSCDGPPEWQGLLRPFGDGRSSAMKVHQFAKMLTGSSAGLSIRATIVPETVHRQTELVAWFHENLGACDFRFEPAYSAFQKSAAYFAATDAPMFVRNFLDAQQEARSRRCSLGLSGVRFDELHGTHCNPLRDVLQVLPSGEATLCSFAYGVDFPPIGAYDPVRDEFELDHQRIQRLKFELMEVPEICTTCINVLHCTRECPERCPVVPGGSFTEGGFRCQVNLHVASAWLREATSPGRSEISASVAKHLAGAPEAIDSRAIWGELERSLRAYPMANRSQPKPPWAERGFEDSSETAWGRIDCRRPDNPPISVYVHIPFCDRLCGCCDCHAVAGGSADEERTFLDDLHEEIDVWASRPGLIRRPITTVHFGGGTPTRLSPDGLNSIIEHLRRRLGISPQTEWALETTASNMSNERIDSLCQAGVTRVHVGLQSLEPAARAFFGRRQEPGEALDRTTEMLKRGLTVSVDLVYGLDGETLQGWIAGIEKVIRAGIHGISLYHLNVTPRNAKYVRFSGAPESELAKWFVFFQAAHQLLEGHGFRKNHFAHFSRPEDRNLYYNHAARGEDLLAIGPSADGIFSNYRYRRAEYARSHQRLRGAPSLEGGLLETLEERRLRQPSAELMSGAISRSELERLNRGELADRWVVDGLLQPERGKDRLQLTGAGSWFIGPMLTELRAS